MSRAVNAIFLLWAGILIGVSLIATPAKFLVPDLSLAHALQIGRTTFHLLAFAEIALLILIIKVIIFQFSRLQLQWHILQWPAVLAVIIALQYLGLLPIIAERSDQVIAGYVSAPSQLHWFYVLIGLIKISILLIAGLKQATNSSTMERL